MKKFSYKLITALAMSVILFALCAFMSRYGFIAILVTALFGILLILWTIISFNLFTGMLFADYISESL